MTDIGVTVDGTWQKRGFSSLNGVVAVISITNGKVLDVESMSRHCKSCMINAPMKNADPKRYESWRIQHEPTCNINYIGSAPNMESTGALSIFKRSLENYGLRYLNYYGEGDSKSFPSVENVYEGAKVVKYECIGNYQKRVGNRLRKLRLRVKGLGGKAMAKKEDRVQKKDEGKVKKTIVIT